MECIHTYHHHGGVVIEVTLDSTGRQQHAPLGAPRIEIRCKTRETIYATYSPTCTVDPTRTIRLPELRFNTATEHAADEVNISENVRAVPPGPGQFAQVKGWRQAVENLNCQSDAHKILRRARAVNAERALTGQIAVAINKNCLARALHYQRLGIQAPATPTTHAGPLPEQAAA